MTSTTARDARTFAVSVDVPRTDGRRTVPKVLTLGELLQFHSLSELQNHTFGSDDASPDPKSDPHTSPRSARD